MISGWRGDRRIGSPTLWERWADPLRFGLIWVGLMTVVSATGVAIQVWGHPIDWFGWSRLWCISFGLPGGIMAITGLFGPNKPRALAFALVGAALLAAVWFLALPLLTALGVVMIIPVAP